MMLLFHDFINPQCYYSMTLLFRDLLFHDYSMIIRWFYDSMIFIIHGFISIYKWVTPPLGAHLFEVKFDGPGGGVAGGTPRFYLRVSARWIKFAGWSEGSSQGSYSTRKTPRIIHNDILINTCYVTLPEPATPLVWHICNTTRARLGHNATLARLGHNAAVFELPTGLLDV
jgi:hypothetical protein